MRKLAILLPILVFAMDESPDKVTQKDLEIVKSFEKRIYMKTIMKMQKEATYKDVLTYIMQNKLAKAPSGKLRISIQGSTGYKNYSGIDNNEKTYYQIALLAKYNIVDPKEEYDLKMKKMKFNQEIVQNVAQYFRSKNTLQALTKQLQMLKLIDTRTKVRVKSGVENLDDRVKLMQQILALNEKINEERVNLFKLKALLVTYVKDEAKDKLREMLQ